MDWSLVLTAAVIVFSIGVSWGLLNAKINKIPESIKYSETQMKLHIQKELSHLKNDMDIKIDALEKTVTQHDTLLNSIIENNKRNFDKKSS